MKMHVIALYSAEFPEVDGDDNLKTRRRRERTWTEVKCGISEVEGRAVARPLVRVPDDAPKPEFRIKLDQPRDQMHRFGVAVVVRPNDHTGSSPEERLLAPLYMNQERVVFEFTRAEVVFVGPGGDAEVRLVAIDRKSGVVGTETVSEFNTRYSPVAARCEKHLAGLTELFPLDPSLWRPGRGSIPEGNPDLTFGERPEVSPLRPMEVGCRVQVMHGPMQGLTGILEREIPDAGEVDLRLTLQDREIPVTLPRDSVAAV